jgi:hypothetical protein
MGAPPNTWRRTGPVVPLNCIKHNLHFRWMGPQGFVGWTGTSVLFANWASGFPPVSRFLCGSCGQCLGQPMYTLWGGLLGRNSRKHGHSNRQTTKITTHARRKEWTTPTVFFKLHSTTLTLTARTYTHPYKYMYANHIPMSTSEGLSRQILRFTKSPYAPRCRRDVAYR